MWEQKTPSHPNTMMEFAYEDFAVIDVEKKANKTNTVSHFVINISIVDVVEQSIDVYKLNDIEKVLTNVKKEIENLYDEIPVMSNSEIEQWIENFEEVVNDY